MRYDPQLHHRRSTRLPDWDYSWAWWYLVTIVVKDRRCVFGHIENDAVVLSELGKTADDCWRQIPQHHPGVGLDDHKVMPNHIHGIILIDDLSDTKSVVRRDVQLNVPTTKPDGPTNPTDGQLLFLSKEEAMATLSPRKRSLSVVVRTFKAAVTTWARDNGAADFGWQGRFHDHIIRNDADLHRIRAYITNNPLRWALDKENPANTDVDRHSDKQRLR